MSSDYTHNSVEPDRALAQIVVIDKVVPIDGASAIEQANVLGWQCVTKKGEFKPGDEAVYVGIDAVLDPQMPPFAFLQGKRLKTKMIRGVLSQGVLFPKACLAECGVDPTTFKIGDNVTQALKVRKWMVSAEMDQYTPQGGSSKVFPQCVPKTDEERVQSMRKVLAELPGQDVVITRKEDGTSTTYVFCRNQDDKEPADSKNSGVFLVCGRNYVLDADGKNNGHYFAMARKFDIEAKMRALGRNLAIQGEIVGPKINGNHLQLRDLDFRVFRIWDIDAHYLVPWGELTRITTDLGLNTVPVIYRGPFKPEWASVDALLKMADQLEYAPGMVAEGLVVATDYGKERLRHSFKVISTKFLLKYDK